jgi:hypothetical protein
MSEYDYKQMINEMVNLLNITYEDYLNQLSNDIEQGIENGYPLETQINLLKNLFKK